MSTATATMLSRTQVADLVGCRPSEVNRWAVAHGVTPTWISGQPQYRADHITAARQAPRLRLARFIRNPLNR
ncbi:hypothetical protein AB0C44_07960 [Micromonospora taraxaci]|uniref:hypothetical protein n=1 Tax=Micromonospora taraxaci TaxID=1316803 RepID=UPI0033D9922E